MCVWCVGGELVVAASITHHSTRNAPPTASEMGVKMRQIRFSYLLLLPLPHVSVQIAPVVSAGSSQSRADVLVIVMSAILVLTGLQWLSLKPKAPVQVMLEGGEVQFRAPGLSSALLAELQW